MICRFGAAVLCLALGILGGAGEIVQPETGAPARERPWPLALSNGFKTLGQAAYLDSVLTLREREAETRDDQPLRNLFLDFNGYYLTLVGEHDAVLNNERAFMEFLGIPQRAGGRLPEDVVSRDAVAAILERTKDRQLVMFNEEHRSTIQRAFVNRVLGGLREQGFTYLALETLDDAELGIINERGYPTLDSGFYMRDPVYGDFVRRAIALGMTVIPYDADQVSEPGDTSPVQAVNRRERGQAENILRQTLAKDPRAKVVVFGGRGHISEGFDADGWTPMGGVLKEIAGVDPLSIDLTIMVELPGREGGLYTAANERGLIEASPVVLQRPDGTLWSGSSSYDIMVIFPRTRDRQGRAHWMEMGGLRKPVAVDLEGLAAERPLLMQAHIPGEGERAVPVDQAILWPGEDAPALMLRPGKYRIQVLDRAGTTVWDRPLDVH